LHNDNYLTSVMPNEQTWSLKSWVLLNDIYVTTSTKNRNAFDTLLCQYERKKIDLNNSDKLNKTISDNMTEYNSKPDTSIYNAHQTCYIGPGHVM